jgi:peptide/nickel transport system permease protein
MSVARLVRSNFLKLRELEFVAAARAIGATPSRLIWVHILPNVISIIIVAATLAVGNAIIAESTLSFLGLGFPPDVPTWGRMLFDAQNYLISSPHMAIFPGLVIFLTVLSINYVGDGLRDALDPKTR